MGRGRRLSTGERGASLVEFALVLPVFFMLILGMFTGGVAYNRKLVLTQATREGARYGATLPLSSYATKDDWLDAVANVTTASAENELDASAEGHYLCVAYVFQPGTLLSQTKRREQIGTAVLTRDAGTCFSDGRPDTEVRVQVVARRASTLEALVFAHNLTLRSQAVARYEVL